MTLQQVIKSEQPFTRDDSERIYIVFNDNSIYSKHKDRLYKKPSCDDFTVEDILADNWYLVDKFYNEFD